MANDFVIPSKRTTGLDFSPGGADTHIIGRVTETSTANALAAGTVITLLGRVVETSTANAVAAGTVITSLGRVVETSTANAVAARTEITSLGRVTETSTANAVAAGTVITLLGRVVETSTAKVIHALGIYPIGAVAEATIALPVNALDVKTYSISVEQNIVGMFYAYRMFISHKIIQDYEFSFEIEQDVLGTVFSYTLPIEQYLHEEYTSAMEITQSVIELLNADGTINNDPPDETLPSRGYVGPLFKITETSGSWSVSARIGHIDVSAVLVGQITVNKEANQAQVASLSIMDTDLSEVIVNSWSKKPVSLVIQHKSSAGEILGETPIFNGSISGYSYDPNSEVFTFSASDDLQDTVRAMHSAGTLTAPEGSTFSRKTTDSGVDGWQWFKASMASVQQSYGMVGGILNYYGWTSAFSLTFTEENILDGSLSVQLQDTKSATNVIDVVVEEDYKSLVEAGTGRIFQDNHFIHKVTVYSPNSVGTYGINRQSKSASISADYSNSMEPWQEKVPGFDSESDDVYMTGPQMANFIIGASNGGFTGECPTDVIPGENDPYKLKVQEFYENCGAKLGGILTETVTVTTSKSVREYNPVWVSKMVYPSSPGHDGPYTETFLSPRYDTVTTVTNEDHLVEVEGTGGELLIIEADDLVLCNTHQDAQDKLEEMVTEAQKEIVEAHRNTLVSFSTLITPALSWGNSVVINTATVRTSGVVHSVTHTMDIDSGVALTEIALKILDAGNVGDSGTVGVTGGFVSDTITCSADGGFDDLVYAENFQMEHTESTVAIPNNQVSLGRY